MKEKGRCRGQQSAAECAVHILSRASSTSTSVTFRFPSRDSFSMMMSDGISSLTVSPSSSDLASQRSQGKMTVSDPYREERRDETVSDCQSCTTLF